MAQPDAVPLTTAKVTAPPPDPPLAVSVSGVPNVPVVEVTVRVAWLALAKFTVVWAEEVAL